MNLIPYDTKIDFMRWRKPALSISMGLMFLMLLLTPLIGLNLGVDFAGGLRMEVHYANSISTDQVKQTLATAGLNQANVQYFGSDRDILISMPAEPESKIVKQGERLGDRASKALAQSGAEIRRVEDLGPQYGKELAFMGLQALGLSLLGILVYVAVRFEWKFALGAILATLHDALMVVGVFVVFHLEFDLTVVAALLTVIGFSLNDTVVVFDRVRENFVRAQSGTVVETMNQAINETLSRTIMTSMTVFLVLVALLLLGGETLKNFSIALLVGVVFGTYSSVFVASALTIFLGVQRQDLMPVIHDENKEVV